MTSQHTIYCKKTGIVLGIQLDGGLCMCPSADECRMAPREQEQWERGMCDDIEQFAIRAALGNNGGEWATHYTEEQKEHWRQFVRELLADAVTAERERCAKLCDEAEKREAETANNPHTVELSVSHAIGASLCAHGLAEKIRRGE